MKLTNRRLLVGGSVLGALLLALLAWWLWPETNSRTEVAALELKQKKAPPPRPDPTAIPQFKEPVEILERLGIDPKVTPHCAIINQWHDRGVPMWSILKNVDAQAMFFNEKELECLTASPLPPGILDTAEQRIRVPTHGRRNPGGPSDPPPGVGG
jgi:hypothetical protein